MRIYPLRKLVPGSIVDNEFIGKTLAPVNERLLKRDQVKIVYGTEYMILPKGKKALCYRKFDDKFGRNKSYTLAYFEWKPISY